MQGTGEGNTLSATSKPQYVIRRAPPEPQHPGDPWTVEQQGMLWRQRKRRSIPLPIRIHYDNLLREYPLSQHQEITEPRLLHARPAHWPKIHRITTRKTKEDVPGRGYPNRLASGFTGAKSAVLAYSIYHDLGDSVLGSATPPFEWPLWQSVNKQEMEDWNELSLDSPPREFKQPLPILPQPELQLSPKRRYSLPEFTEPWPSNDIWLSPEPPWGEEGRKRTRKKIEEEARLAKHWLEVARTGNYKPFPREQVPRAQIPVAEAVEVSQSTDIPPATILTDWFGSDVARGIMASPEEVDPETLRQEAEATRKRRENLEVPMVSTAAGPPPPATEGLAQEPVIVHESVNEPSQPNPVPSIVPPEPGTQGPHVAPPVPTITVPTEPLTNIPQAPAQSVETTNSTPPAAPQHVAIESESAAPAAGLANNQGQSTQPGALEQAAGPSNGQGISGDETSPTLVATDPSDPEDIEGGTQVATDHSGPEGIGRTSEESSSDDETSDLDPNEHHSSAQTFIADLWIFAGPLFILIASIIFWFLDCPLVFLAPLNRALVPWVITNANSTCFGHFHEIALLYMLVIVLRSLWRITATIMRIYNLGRDRLTVPKFLNDLKPTAETLEKLRPSIPRDAGRLAIESLRRPLNLASRLILTALLKTSETLHYWYSIATNLVGESRAERLIALAIAVWRLFWFLKVTLSPLLFVAKAERHGWDGRYSLILKAKLGQLDLTYTTSEITTSTFFKQYISRLSKIAFDPEVAEHNQKVGKFKLLGCIFWAMSFRPFLLNGRQTSAADVIFTRVPSRMGYVTFIFLRLIFYITPMAVYWLLSRLICDWPQKVYWRLSPRVRDAEARGNKVVPTSLYVVGIASLEMLAVKALLLPSQEWELQFAWGLCQMTAISFWGVLVAVLWLVWFHRWNRNFILTQSPDIRTDRDELLRRRKGIIGFLRRKLAWYQGFFRGQGDAKSECYSEFLDGFQASIMAAQVITSLWTLFIITFAAVTWGTWVLETAGLGIIARAVKSTLGRITLGLNDKTAMNILRWIIEAIYIVEASYLAGKLDLKSYMWRFEIRRFADRSNLDLLGRLGI